MAARGAGAAAGSTVRRIGFLLPDGPRTTVVRGQLEAFHQGLKEYGWIEGQNISVEYRFAEGKEDELLGRLQKRLGTTKDDLRAEIEKM